MTVLVAKLPPSLAIKLARVADDLGMAHAEVAILALRLFIRSQPQKDKGIPK